MLGGLNPSLGGVNKTLIGGNRTLGAVNRTLEDSLNLKVMLRFSKTPYIPQFGWASERPLSPFLQPILYLNYEYFICCSQKQELGVI